MSIHSSHLQHSQQTGQYRGDKSQDDQVVSVVIVCIGALVTERSAGADQQGHLKEEGSSHGEKKQHVIYTHFLAGV